MSLLYYRKKGRDSGTYSKPSENYETKRNPLKTFTETEVLSISEPPEQKFAKRELSSNWKKYEDVQVSEDAQSNAYDFGALLQKPISVGGHFFFKSEQNWNTSNIDNITPEFSEYFNLNISMLNGGISSIPFYERHGYSEEMFNDSDIQSMKVTAAMAKGKYDESLKHVKKRKMSVIKNKMAVSIKKEEIPSNLEPDFDEKELDELLNLLSVEKKLDNIKAESTPTNSSETIVPLLKKVIEVKETKEDMLNWLDNILDD